MAKKPSVMQVKAGMEEPKKQTKKEASLANAKAVKKYEQSHGNKTSDWKEYMKAAKRMK